MAVVMALVGIGTITVAVFGSDQITATIPHIAMDLAQDTFPKVILMSIVLG